jgi:hypothetical protein
LVGSKGDGKEALDQSQDPSNDHGGQNADKEAMGIIRGGKPAEGTHEHHALYSQIEDPAPLGKDFSDRSKEDRCTRLNGNRQNEDKASSIHHASNGSLFEMRCLAFENDPQPIFRKKITPKDKEEQRSFKDQADGRRKMHDRLELITSHQKTGEKKSNKKDPDGVKSGEPSHDNPDVSVSDNQSLLQSIVNSRRFSHAGKSCQSSAHKHHCQRVPG